MTTKNINVKISRGKGSDNVEPAYSSYTVPIEEGMSVLDVLDYIYENLDSTISYYSHTACKAGICSNCSVVVNGKVSLACQKEADGDMTIEPVKNLEVVKDLVYYRKGEIK